MNKDLSKMVDDFRKSPGIYQPSKFWQSHNKRDYDLLEKNGGYANFKKTINLHYFQFSTHIRDWQLWHLLRISNPLSYLKILFSLRFESPPKECFQKPRNVWLYKLFMAMLISEVKKIDSNKILSLIEEPVEGSPFLIFYEGRLISQDICNSIIEFYSICKEVSPLPDKNFRVIELGGGYGRLAFIFLSVFKNIKYVMCDIPPALYIAQRYLSFIFPNKRIFGYRDFKDFKDIEEEYDKAEIIFLLPHQMGLLPKGSFDLFVNISSFGEMRFDQIDNYSRLIDSLCSGFFYNKQWLHSINNFDNITIDFGKYPILPSWKVLYIRPAIIQNRFMEALYKIGDKE